jgi:hypothetical protein
MSRASYQFVVVVLAVLNLMLLWWIGTVTLRSEKPVGSVENHFFSNGLLHGYNSQRILYCIVSSSLLLRLDVVEQLLQNAQDWCEIGHRVTVIIDTFDAVDAVSFAAEVGVKYQCLHSYLAITLVPHPVLNMQGKPTNLAAVHRKHFAREQHKHDVFIVGNEQNV